MQTKLLPLSFLLHFISPKVLVNDLNNHQTTSQWEDFAKNVSKHTNLDLDNLGARISQTVHENLKPVREMEFRFRVKYGIGGTTVATFTDRQYIFREGVIYECDGTIVENNGTCSGTSHRPKFSEREGFCYAIISGVVDNWYCITTGGSIDFAYSNGKGKCESTDSSVTLLISEQEYRKLCQNREYPATYKYFTERLGDHGSDVHCSDNSRPYVCTLTEERNDSIVYSTGSSIQMHCLIVFMTLLHILFLEVIFT